MTLQYRYEHDDTWLDFELYQYRCFIGLNPTVIFREKPSFEPDYYQNKYDPHDIVFWHDQPEGFEDWIRVDVYPHTN